MLAGDKKRAEELGGSYTMWPWRLRIDDPRFSPFYTDMSPYIKEVKSYDGKLDHNIFKDPFSNDNLNIRFSQKYAKDRFCLISNGPDMVSDIDERKVFGLNLAEEHLPHPNQIYDPTNGTFSRGDIFINFYVGEDVIRKVLALRDLPPLE
jgi:hypothetical protein